MKDELNGKTLLYWRRSQLKKGGRAIDLDWLLDMAGGLTWSSLQQLYLDEDKVFVLDKSLEQLELLWSRHLKEKIPLQYLIGRCPWRDFELEVVSGAMIPRQETELLVDFGLTKAAEFSIGRWADLGSGSGALAVSLAKALSDWEGHVVDVSENALMLAQRNLARLVPASKTKLHLGSWWDPLKPWWGTFSLVLANPPYIPELVMDQLDQVVKDHEPYIALCGGSDGLIAIREIISGSLIALAPGGWLMMEHHHDQSHKVLDLMNKAGLLDVSFERDLQGIRRFALGRRSPKLELN